MASSNRALLVVVLALGLCTYCAGEPASPVRAAGLSRSSSSKPVIHQAQKRRATLKKDEGVAPVVVKSEATEADLISQQISKPPSFKWALLANWMYFLALGLSIPVLPRVISTIVNPDGSPDVSPASSVLGGDVEALDKVFTFLGVGFLGALSDVLGRKALMAYSALGFALTCFLQARATSSIWWLYLADLVDGCSSCMATVCQSYVIDASSPEDRAGNLGVFQGVSVAGAFILGFPLSGVISAKYGLRAPLYAASAVGLLNFAIIALFTPESLPAEQRKGQKLDLKQANPFGALRLLFGRTPLLRGCATAFFLLWLSNMCVNALFGNYVNHKFGWGPEQSGPILVLIGIVLAVAPRLLVPKLGLRRSMEFGTLIYAAGQLASSVARTPPTLVYSMLVMSIGCIGTVALVTLIANQAEPNERGALLGGLETLQELCEALAHSGYGRLFAYSISDKAPFQFAGAPFAAAAAIMLAALGVIEKTLGSCSKAAAAFLAM